MTTRILVVRFSSMGDVILTSPLVRALPILLDGDVEVHFLTKSAFAPAVDGLPGIHRLWTIDHVTTEVEPELQRVGFHYVVDLHANARSGFVKRALRKGEGRTLDLTVDKRSGDKILLVRTGWDRLNGQHVVERYLNTLRPFGDALAALAAAGDDARLALPPGSGPSEPRGTGGICMALGAAHAGKAIPEDHWLEVIVAVAVEGREVHLIGGPAESDMAQRLVKAASEADHRAGQRVNNHCGKWGWSETFQHLASADALIAGDTGSMHAGSALQVPMVVVWGCTSPALGMGPWKAHPLTVQLHPESPARTRPCSRLGNRCRHRTPCIQRVAPQRILKALQGVLSQTAP